MAEKSRDRSITYRRKQGLFRRRRFVLQRSNESLNRHQATVAITAGLRMK